MLLDSFLASKQLPTAKEIVGVCREVGIEFHTRDGQPVLRYSRTDRDIATLMARLIQREPWRSQVIQEAGLDVSPVETEKKEAEDVLAMAAKVQSEPCRCGSTEFVDAKIHEGKSVRRDCKRCKRTAGFPVWYGKT